MSLAFGQDCGVDKVCEKMCPCVIATFGRQPSLVEVLRVHCGMLARVVPEDADLGGGDEKNLHAGVPRRPIWSLID